MRKSTSSTPTLRCDEYGCKHAARWSVSAMDNGVARAEWRPMCGVHVRAYDGKSWWQVVTIDPVAYATRLAAQVAADAEEKKRAEERRAAALAAAEARRLERIAEAQAADAAEWMWEREERVGWEGEPPVVYYHVVRAGHAPNAFSSIRIVENEPGMPPTVSWAGGSWPAAAAVVYAEAITAAVAEARSRAAAAE